MANNPFDPPIVQVKKTLNRGGLSTVNRGYGSLKSSTRKTRQAPPAEQPEWWPENLSELGDVDVVTTPPTNGQSLVWDDTKWIPYTVSSGGAVGLWENDKTVTFTLPAWVETDLQGSPINLPTARPAVAQVSITVTAPMLVSASDSADIYPVGFDQMLVFSATANHQGTASIATLSAELAINGSVRSSASDSGHTNTERGNIHLFAVGVNVGDVVEFRAWHSVAGSKIDWTAHRFFPTRIGKNPGEDGSRFLYRDVEVLATNTPFSPTTVLTVLPTWTSTGSSGYRVYESDLDSGESQVTPGRTYLSGGTYGFIRASGGDYSNPSPNGSIFDQTVPTYWGATYPTQIKFDRISLPPPPL